jgi:hypothetical protein
MQDEGGRPYRERPEEPVSIPTGDHGPFKGQVPERSDEQIKSDVETALFYDSAVSSLGIQVQVAQGVVTLSGTVDSEQAKQVADSDTWKVAGVKGVKNELQVRGGATPSRAAGEDLVQAKPPYPIYGEPPQ